MRLKAVFILAIVQLAICSVPGFADRLEISGRDLFSERNLHIGSGPRGNVLIFMSAKCPCSNSHVKIVQNLSDLHKDFHFVIVHSNADEPLDQARSYFKATGLTIPVIEDQGSKLADRFKASRTPHAFVLDTHGMVVFKGGVTDSTDGPHAETNFLDLALKDLEAGRPVKTSMSRTLGCSISRTL